MTDTANKATIKVQIPNELEIKRIIDLLINGFEQAISYWAQHATHEIPDGFDMKAYREENGFGERWEHNPASYQVSNFYLAPFVGGAIIFQEIVDELSGETKVHLLDLAAIKQGLSIMAKGGMKDKKWGCGSQHFSDWVNENDDSITADVFIQCCVLGDIVYG